MDTEKSEDSKSSVVKQIPKVILSPHGFAVVVSSIISISNVEYMWSCNVISGLYFIIFYGNSKECNFSYSYIDYIDDKDTLLVKVENIRKQILRYINDGKEVKEIFGNINLKKKNG